LGTGLSSRVEAKTVLNLKNSKEHAIHRVKFSINIVVVLCFIKESIMTNPCSYCILLHAVDVNAHETPDVVLHPLFVGKVPLAVKVREKLLHLY
jgi:hypothetical protein